LKIINEYINSKQYLNNPIFTINNDVMKEMNEKIGKLNDNNIIIKNKINNKNLISRIIKSKIRNLSYGLLY
jgi:hypothetical protein